MPVLHVALFLTTLFTTTVRGAYLAHGEASMFPLADGL
jgi:hypothetical protein